MTKVLVIGLDGATWNLLEPWAKEGTLPTIKRLMGAGVWGKLESTIPFITFPAWKCYSTGKNPGKLGVFLFLKLDITNKKIVVHNARDFKSKEIWDYLGENGLKCGVINMPGTYPTKKINGFIVAGYPAEDHNYTYPRSLETELKSKGYTIHPKIALDKDSFKKKITYIKDLFSSRFDLAKEHKDSDFLHLTIFYIDDIQHFVWNDYHTVKEYWRHLDKEISEIIDDIGDDCYVFLMSDHGFNKLNNTFFINNWLLKHGYITLVQQNVKMHIAKHLPESKTISRILDRLGLLWIIKFIPTNIKKTAVKQRFDFLHLIDWNATTAVGIGGGVGMLYINNKDKLKDEQEYITLKEDLKKELENMRDPTTGDKPMDVFKREDVYKGPYVSEAPELIITPKSGYQIMEVLSDSGNIFGECPRGREAFHERYGIFLAYGPDIKKGVEIQDAKIYDLAPTILHIFGTPIPKDMDGRVLKEIFKEDSELAKMEIKYQEIDEKGTIKEKIKDLKKSKKI